MHYDDATEQLCMYNTIAHPRLLVLEGNLTLSGSDEVVWQSSTLHNVVSLVSLPGHSELDVPLELTLGATHRALDTSKPIARPASKVKLI